MDILIKNMEMPSKCFDCGFCYDGDRIRYCLATPWQKEIRKEVFPKRREDFCPLVALPEDHGRLGDLDLVEEWMRKKHKENDCPFNIDAFLFALKKFPTIVEASNGSDN